MKKTSPDGPFVSTIFSDNMVLQRGRPIPVWGWADPGTKITVALADKRAAALAGPDGEWIASLPVFEAGGPHTLTVSGPQTAEFQNVLIGDVWICSGQSNMGFGIGGVVNAAQEIAEADYPEIRLFTVQNHVGMAPQSELAGSWAVCSPETLGSGSHSNFSAVAYFFGRELNRDLNIPIGLINTSWGGTPAEAWTSGEMLKTLPEHHAAVIEIAREAAEREKAPLNLVAMTREWYRKVDPGSEDGLGWADPGLDTSDWRTMDLPTVWEQAGLPDFDGIVWFRRTIDLSADAAGKDAVLHLGPIDDRDTTWVNGVCVGGMDFYDAVRDYSIPAGTLTPGRNVIAVRVLDVGGNGGIYGKPEQMSLEIAGEEPITLAGPWAYQASTSLSDSGPVPGMEKYDQNSPTVLYNGMIAPVIPYGIKGAIWYQGESNCWRAARYQTLLTAMISGWRADWKQGDFPFYIVQLANFLESTPEPGENDWAELREAQLKIAQAIPNSGLAVTIDIGETWDVHPTNKQDVGKRLALAALAKTYGKEIEYSGPVYKSMEVAGNAAVLSFDHITGGLAAKGGGSLTGFAIAGEDRHFVWADAVIKGDLIEVSSARVEKPAAVRYAWGANPVCNLTNETGLPASPFRTDSWPGLTDNNR